jgi:hypothetical protein
MAIHKESGIAESTVMTHSGRRAIGFYTAVISCEMVLPAGAIVSSGREG